ncbi:MAG: arginase family protein [Akkermansia sp.]
MKQYTTLRLIYPQWQGGVNKDYYFGGKLMAFIAPENSSDDVAEVPVDTNFAAAMERVDGIDYGSSLLKQQQEAYRILDAKQPDQLIVFGGECSVSQVPFDYLHGKYGEKLGILWLDAHPDVADSRGSTHLHEYVLGNLLGVSPNSEITAVRTPFKPEQVMYAGLIEEELRPVVDEQARTLGIRIATPQDLVEGSAPILNWIRENGIKYLAVHWDLDVLSMDDFRSNTQSKPHMTKAQYGEPQWENCPLTGSCASYMMSAPMRKSSG